MGNEDSDILGRTLQQVAQKLNVLQVQYDEHLIATKGRFSLFTVLLEESDETRLHSRYLAHLLNPSGTHDYGTLFLELFLKVLREKGVLPREGQIDLKEVKVRCEVSVCEGRLDILIESPEWGPIAIENKIWAGEQPDQIARYASYLNRQYPHRSCIPFYLTLFGEASNTANLHKYHRISYREHILDWLEECLRETYLHVNINQALQQYKNIVCKLVGRPTLETEYMEKMKEVVRTHPDIITNWSALKQAVEQLQEEYRNRLLDELKTQLERGGMHLEPTTPGGGSKSLEWFVRKQPTEIRFGQSETPINIRLQANWSGSGLVLVNGVVSDSPEMATFCQAVLTAATGQHVDTGGGWSGGAYTVSDGDCLTDAILARLLDHPEELQKPVSGWVSRISKYVDAVVSVCNEQQ